MSSKMVHIASQAIGCISPYDVLNIQRPIWLEMCNTHPNALRQNPIRFILKLGDDLRQDIITLRMLSVFEKVFHVQVIIHCSTLWSSLSTQLWQEQGLDLELIPYGCIATGPQAGFIEVVKNARTINQVSQFIC